MNKSYTDIILEYLKEYKSMDCKIHSVITPERSCIITNQYGEFGWITGKISKIPESVSCLGIKFIVTTSKKVTRGILSNCRYILGNEIEDYLIKKSGITDTCTNNIQIHSLRFNNEDYQKLRNDFGDIEKFFEKLFTDNNLKTQKSTTEYNLMVDKITAFLNENNFVYPTIKHPIYKIIKELVTAYNIGEISEDKIKKLESLKGWEWDYQRLQNKGAYWEKLYNEIKIHNKKELSPEDIKMINILRSKYNKKKLSHYFIKKYKEIGILTY